MKSRLVVDALLRRARITGGSAMVLARGDGDRGGILVQWCDRGEPLALYEAVLAASDSAVLWREVGTGNPVAVRHPPPDDAPERCPFDLYWERRRRNDPDLWVVELDIAKDQRFAAEWLGLG